MTELSYTSEVYDLDTVEGIEAIDPNTNNRGAVRALRHAARRAAGRLVSGAVCHGSPSAGGWKVQLTETLDRFDDEAAIARAAVAKAVAILEAHEGPALAVPAPTAEVGPKAQAFAEFAAAAGSAVSSDRVGDADVVTASGPGGTVVVSWQGDKYVGGTFTRAVPQPGKKGEILLRIASEARQAVLGEK